MSFSKKAAEIMHTLQTDYGDFKIPINRKQTNKDKQLDKPCKHSCSAVEVKITPISQNKKYNRDNLLLQTPIIIEKKNHAKSMSANRTFTQRKINSIKKVEPFIPISIPTRDRNKLKLQSTMQTSNRNKQIQIFLDDDSQDKECLKKLFKKINNLTAQLAQSQKERVRMQLQLDHISKRDISCREHQKMISKLQGEKYRLEVENQMLKKNAKDMKQATPKETIKELVVQRPVEVKVEVPKYIPGPERIIEKIVQVPKYVQIQRKIPQIIVKQIQVQKIVQKPIYIDKPIYQQPIIVDKPVYIDKPVYVDRAVEVEKKVEVQVPYEVEVPVYVDRPMVDQQWLRRFQQLQEQLGIMMKDNQYLKSENHNLKISMNKLQSNLDLLNQHNRDKNRQIQVLLSNRGDYLPPKLQQQRIQRKYSTLDRTNSTFSPRSHVMKYW